MYSSIRFILFLIFIPICANAQPNKANADTALRAAQTDVGDLIRLRRIILNKHIIDSGLQIQTLEHPALRKESSGNKRRQVMLAVFPAVGYALQTGLTAIIATNLSFYTGKDKSATNLSSININPTKSLQYSQFILNMNSNIWLNKNTINLIGDWRYYHYPTYTYGLGGHTLPSDAELIDYYYIRFYQTLMHQVFRPHYYAGLGYQLDDHYQIKGKNPSSDFGSYNNGSSKTVSSGISFNLSYDSRRNINNPQKAVYINLAYRVNEKFLGSDQNWQSIYLDTRKYFQLTNKGDQILGIWCLNWFTLGHQPPYLDLPSTGWDAYSNTGRGYIQSRLRGPALIYLETEYRASITRNGLLGGVVFANTQSVAEASYRFETIMPAAGVGLRLKLNKISGANLAIDYAFGRYGSRGFFFNIGEVF